MTMKKLVTGGVAAAALTVLAFVAGPAGSAEAQKPKDAEADGIVVMHWRHTADGWNGLPESGGGSASHMQDNPADVYQFGQTNPDGTVTTFGDNKVKRKE